MKKIISKSALLLSGIFASASLYAGGITTGKESGTTMVCPTINVGISSTNNALCFGSSTGSAVANASGGKAPYSYSWTSGSTMSSASGLVAGMYTVTVTDSNGCMGSTTVTITQPAQLKLNAAAFPVSCNGSCNGSISVTVNGGTPGYTYLWNNGQTSLPETNLCAGTYSVVIRDANGCSADTTGLIVSQPAAMVLTKSVLPAYCGLSNGAAWVNVSGGTGGYAYSWSNGITTSSLNNVSAGTYCVTVEDANKCVDSICMTVPVGPSPHDSIIINKNISCNGGNDGSVTGEILGGNPPFTFSWSTTPVQTTTTITGLVAGTYTFTAEDSYGCVVNETVTLAQPAPVVPTATITPTIISPGGTAVLTTSATGGTPPYNFSWSPSNCTSTPCTIGPNVTTTYTITVTDSNGCAGAPITSVLQVSGLLSVSLSGNTTICQSTTTTLNANVSGGCPGYTYTWAPGGMTGASINVTPLSTTWYYVTIDDSCGERMIDSIMVTVIPAPILTVSKGGSTCAGGSVPIAALGAITYVWTPTASVGCFTCASTTASPSTTTTYTVIGTNAAGCSISDTVVVYVQNVSAAFTYSGVCSGNTIAFTDESAGSIVFWQWSFGDGATSTLQNPTHTFATDGMYTVSEVVKNDSGCAATVSSPVGVYPGNGFDLTGSLQICADTPSGSNASIQACIFNNKCTVVKGTMKLLLDTAFHITNTVSDSVAHVSGDTLIWNYSNLSDTGMIHCVSLTGNTSNVPAGDSIFASLFITPLAGDSNPSNNSVTYWIKPSLNNCVGLPFDPNEKSVMPAGDISDTVQLTYTIHFQNTGTATAKNVVVIDTLSPYVDPTTLRITSSSSQVVTTIASGHIVKFTFNNIDLPDTARSKTSSIGILEYTIYPMNTDVGGDVIKNTAGIYFDANPVVKTNTTVSTIATKIVSVENIAAPVFNIRCFPNPFTSTTSVVFNTDGKHYLELDDMTGRVVESIECTGKQYELSGNNLAKGVYFIKAYNADKSNVAVTKVVLQ